jgi:CBS domain-containing protein
MPTIDAYMTREIVTADPRESVDKLASRMRDEKTGAILLVENEKLVGLVSERDIMCRVVAAGRDPVRTEAKQVATLNVVSVPADMALRSCAEMLRELGVRHLPVVDDDERPIGIISARDFFESVAGRLEDLVGRIRYGEQLEANTDPYDHVGGSYGR